MPDYSGINHTVDFILPLGRACRPAEALRRNNLRYFSSPFDWLADTHLDGVLFLLKNDFAPFFRKWKVYTVFPDSKKLGVLDQITGMKSVHDFPGGCELRKEYATFLALMHKRYERMINALESCENFAIVVNKAYEGKAINEFVDYFHKRFNKPFILINILHNDQIEKIEMRDRDTTKIYSIAFNDTHPDYGKAASPNTWKGNMYEWDRLLKSFHINRLSLAGND